MSLLSIKHAFGILTCLSDCIDYVDDYCYLYPSNRHIIFYNIDYKCQRLINYGNEFDILKLLSVSPNKELLGIVLNTFDKCRIIIYDINGGLRTPVRKRKVLSLGHQISSIQILSLVFSPNSKFVVALYGEPDYFLVCWSTDRFKCVATSQLDFVHLDLSHNPIHFQVSFNPIDSSELLITGNHIYLKYRLRNNRFSTHGQGEFWRCQSMNIICHCWLNENTVLVGLDNGFISTINKHGNIIEEYNVRRAGQSTNLLYQSLNAFSSHSVRSQSLSNLNIEKERINSTSNLSSTLTFRRKPSSAIVIGEDHYRRRRSFRESNTTLTNNTDKVIDHNLIICLLPFSRGVFVSTAAGDVIMYERSENSDRLTYLRRLILPRSSTEDLSLKKIVRRNISNNLSMLNVVSSRSLFKEDIRLFNSSNEIIESLSLSPNEETLLCGTNRNHIYQIHFSKMDYRSEEASIFTHALHGSHKGSIKASGISLRKPILFTLGVDWCLKLWNLETMNEEFNHQFKTEARSLSIHPNDIFICIRFVDVVHIYIYTIDGLILLKQFSICNSRCIEYSNQGHMLAIVYDNILQIHNHIDYDQIRLIRDNHKKFKLIRWSRDDAFLLTVDFDDLVIRWNPYTSERLEEYQLEDFCVEDLLISRDNKLAYLLSNEKKIKELILMRSIRDINISFDNFNPTSLSINPRGQNLFIGSQNGSIYSIQLTQTNTILDNNTSHHLLQTNVHHGPITKILISLINDLIISTGEDGNIIIYNLNESKENKELKRLFRDEILVQERIVQNENIELNNFISREFQISREYEVQLEIKEAEYLKDLNQVDLHCQSHLNTIKIKLTELRQQKVLSKKAHEQELSRLIENKQNQIDKSIREKSEHLKEVYLRDQSLDLQITNLKMNKNEEKELNNCSYHRNIELIHLSYRDKRNSIENKYLNEYTNTNKRIDYFEQVKRVYDQYITIELNNLSKEYQTKFVILRDQIEQLQNEEVLLDIRIEQLQFQSNNFHSEMKHFQIERNEVIHHITQLHIKQNSAKQTIEQRNSILIEKLKRANQMENRRDELEKFAYVFNYKIRELTNEIDPRERERQALIQLFNNMDNEYDILTKNNEKHSIQIDDNEARLRATEKQITIEIQSIVQLNERIRNVKEDLKLCCHLIDEPQQLRKLIRKLYEKCFLYFDTNIHFGQMNLSDSHRQRTYFEQSNQRLKTKIHLNIKRNKMKEFRRIKEQINLMQQISSYSLKVVQLERILSHLDIISNFALQMNITTSDQILHALIREQGYHFIQDKQREFNSILNKQEKRIEQLTNFIKKIEKDLKETFSTSIDQSTRISSNLIE